MAPHETNRILYFRDRLKDTFDNVLYSATTMITHNDRFVPYDP